jgi:hypothetical protein
MTTLSHPAQSTLFLRRALWLDAIPSAGMGLALAVTADLASGMLGLPASLLRTAGLSLMPFALLVAALAVRPQPRPALVLAIIAYNVMWALDSVVLLVAGLVTPTALGMAFVLAQAAIVAGFAGLQWTGLRKAARF